MADDDFQCCASGTHEWKGSPMSEQAQVGDTVRLTITIVGVVGNYDGCMRVGGRVLEGTDRTIEILSRATRPLPSEPGTWWVDMDGYVWTTTSTGALFCPGNPLRKPQKSAPFHQLVLK